ncbi:DUF2969 family protein [Fructilactobacillus vespulae]|uniref:DUF2969 family protein n=1 Tax=Fructilactobacillus vespulae TaxID=1249630 RepID=UPI0039B4AEAF
MSRRNKEFEIKVVDDPKNKGIQLVQINNNTVGTISNNEDKFEVVVGDNKFYEKNETDALHQVIREFNLHQK